MYKINSNTYEVSNREFISQVIKSVIKNNIFGTFIVIATILFIVPLFTHEIKKHSPGTQTFIKFLCYFGATVSSAVAYVYELQPSTLAKRRFIDADKNVDYTNKLESFIQDRDRINMHKAMQDQIAMQKDMMRYPQLSGMTISTAAESEQSIINNPFSNNFAQFQLPTISTANDDINVDAAYDFITDPKNMSNQHLLVYGGSGDCKTSFLHYLQHRWLKKDPTLITYVCDRKFTGFSEDNKNFRSNWGGLPVYEDLDKLVTSNVPSPSIYCEPNPKLDQWLKPVYDLVINVRCKFGKPEDDPLWDPVNKRVKTVLVIIDDATSNLSNLAETDSKAASDARRYIREIVTMGRSVGVVIVFVTHTNANNELQIGTSVISNLNPVMGSSFADNQTVAAQNKKEMLALDLIRRDAARKAKGFSTAWVNNPYIPPAQIKEGLHELIDTKLVCIWHKEAYDGFILDESIPWQESSFKKHGFNVSDRKNSPIILDEPPTVVKTKTRKNKSDSIANPEMEIDVEPMVVLGNNTEIISDPWDNPDACSQDILIYEGLRDFYKSSMRNFHEGAGPKPTIHAIQDAYINLSRSIKNVPREEAINELPTVWKIITMNDTDYQNHVYGNSKDMSDDLLS